MTDYGAIDGSQASDSDHPPPHKVSLPSVATTMKDLLTRPWVRVAVAVSLVLVVALSHHNSSASDPLYLYGTTTDLLVQSEDSHEDFHDENQELFYDDQLVNHFNGDTSTWSNRYYKSTNYFKGPGHPIFLVVGGEGSLDKMLYPFVTQHLAPHFGASVIEIE